MLKEISIEILQRCPNRCIYCSSHSNPSATNMIPFSVITAVLDDVKRLGCETICISGGEPFLHPQITDIVRYVKMLGMTVYVYTSGIYLNADNVYMSLPNELIESIRGTVDNIIFNVEADIPALYNMIMGTDVGGFELMKKSISDCVVCGINVEAHVVPMKLNFMQIESIFKMCYSLGVSKVSILRLVMQGRALEKAESVLLNDDDNVCVLKKISNLCNEYKGKVRIGLPYSDGGCKLYCKAASEKINIRYDGRVYPCEVFKDDLQNLIFKSEPDNIYNMSFCELFEKSIYLNQVRSYIDRFKHNSCAESCIGQYMLNQLNLRK